MNGGRRVSEFLLPLATSVLILTAPGCEALVATPGADRGESEKQGFVCRTFTSENGDPHDYVLFIPYGLKPADHPPVVLYLNGWGENGIDGLRQISRNMGAPVWEMREYFPFVLVAPQCRPEGSWSADSLDTRRALQILESVIDEFDADADRVYVTGPSSGGRGVWQMASAHHDRFAAAVPLCAFGGWDVAQIAKGGLPIWNFYNKRDAESLVEGNRDVRRRLIEAGLSPLATEYPDTGHDCWNRAYRTPALYGWMLEQSRTKNAAAGRFEFIPGEELLRRCEQIGAGEWSVDNDGVLIGRGETEGDPGALLFPAASGSFEMHVDAWLPEKSNCRIAIVRGPAARSQQGLQLSVVLPEEGGGGISRLENECIVRLDPAAQRSLWAAAWNDVRVRLNEGRLTVRLNGWPAVDLDVQAEVDSQDQLRFAFLAPEDNEDKSEVRFRYVRTRVP